VKDRKGECVGAIGMTVNMQGQTQQQMVDTLLPSLRDAARALRTIL